MTAMRFPADRTAFVSLGSGEPILVPSPTAYVVYADALCTVLATITDLLGVPVADSRIVTDQQGLFPEWIAPDGATRLYGRPPIGSTYPVIVFAANYGDRLDVIGTGLTGLTGKVDKPVLGTATGNILTVQGDGSVAYTAPRSGYDGGTL